MIYYTVKECLGQLYDCAWIVPLMGASSRQRDQLSIRSVLRKKTEDGY